jgi:hypothetical protein
MAVACVRHQRTHTSANVTQPCAAGLPAGRDDVEAAAKPASHGPTAAQQPSAAAATTDGSGSTAADAADSSVGAPVLGATQLPGAVAVGRTYSYEDEATCDKHVEIFLQAIATGAKLPGQGFAAIKVWRCSRCLNLYCCSCAMYCMWYSGSNDAQLPCCTLAHSMKSCLLLWPQQCMLAYHVSFVCVCVDICLCR